MANLKLATIAAKWWTNAIAFPTINSFSNGDPSDNRASLLMLLGYVNAKTHYASNFQLANFRNILSKRIDEELSKTENLELDCEYDPCFILDEVAMEAGINNAVFPYKTKMSITPDSVKVQKGYNAKWTTIYSESSREA